VKDETASDLAGPLTWLPSTAAVTLFVVMESRVAPPLSMANTSAQPDKVTIFPLEDELGVMGDRRVFSYDATFAEVPRALRDYLLACLDEARGLGAIVAWCAVEGSFHFEHLLTPDIAHMVYAVADEEGAEVSSGDALGAPTWAARLARARARALAATASFPAAP
jgi:hypothetical protein